MDLTKVLPSYYDQNVSMQTLQRILSQVTDDLEEGLSSTISECFVSTAAKLLPRYENLLGLAVDVSKSEEFRRERIEQKSPELEPRRNK